jgi:hypothetical protein
VNRNIIGNSLIRGEVVRTLPANAGRNEFICEAADPFSFGFELPAKFADLIP